MLKKCSVVLMVLMVSALVTGMGKPAAPESAPKISKEELKAGLGRPNLVVIDVRAAKDWAESGEKIAGAVREDPASPENWAGRYPKEGMVVLYCA
jgi:rhodanese-related sulfurtransferase